MAKVWNFYQKKKSMRECIEEENRMCNKKKRVIKAIGTAAGLMIVCFPMGVLAEETVADPIAVVNNLSDFIFGLIRAVGMIVLGFGIVQVGMSFKTTDPTQRVNGFMTLAGGAVITFAKEILSLITG